MKFYRWAPQKNLCAAVSGGFSEELFCKKPEYKKYAFF